MVLSPSDYSVPKPGEQMDPTKPMDFASRFAGMAVALTAVYFAWNLAKNRLAPAADSTLGGLTGGLVSYSGQGGGDPWDGI